MVFSRSQLRSSVENYLGPNVVKKYSKAKLELKIEFSDAKRHVRQDFRKIKDALSKLHPANRSEKGYTKNCPFSASTDSIYRNVIQHPLEYNTDTFNHLKAGPEYLSTQKLRYVQSTELLQSNFDSGFIITDKQKLRTTKSSFDMLKNADIPRKPMKQSEDYLGVQGINPRTGKFDLSTSDPNNTDNPADPTADFPANENTVCNADENAVDSAKENINGPADETAADSAKENCTGPADENAANAANENTTGFADENVAENGNVPTHKLRKRLADPYAEMPISPNKRRHTSGTWISTHDAWHCIDDTTQEALRLQRKPGAVCPLIKDDNESVLQMARDALELPKEFEDAELYYGGQEAKNILRALDDLEKRMAPKNLNEEARELCPEALPGDSEKEFEKINAFLMHGLENGFAKGESKEKYTLGVYTTTRSGKYVRVVDKEFRANQKRVIVSIGEEQKALEERFKKLQEAKQSLVWDPVDVQARVSKWEKMADENKNKSPQRKKLYTASPLKRDTTFVDNLFAKRREDKAKEHEAKAREEKALKERANKLREAHKQEAKEREQRELKEKAAGKQREVQKQEKKNAHAGIDHGNFALIAAQAAFRGM